MNTMSYIIGSDMHIYDDNGEIWKDIPGYDGKYQASNSGNIRRAVKMRGYPALGLLSPYMQNNGYPGVRLSNNGQVVNYSVHTLIALTFIGKRPDGYMVNHKNGIRTDNQLSNLEYVTPSQNQIHSRDRLKRSYARGENHGIAKLTKKDVIEIRDRLNNGHSVKSVAADFKISEVYTRQLRRRVTWKHI